jgi:dipeptidyl aminopeptidase/acylaminoacyl peptidase
MKLLYRINTITLLFIALQILPIKCHSQQKRKLTPDDYKLWNTLASGKLADDGSWISYSISHADDKDTLYLKNTATNFKYSFPSGHGENFTSDSNWFSYIKNDSLNLLNLHTGKMRRFEGLSQDTFTPDSRYVLLYNEALKTFTFHDLKTFITTTIENVKEKNLNPNGNMLAIITEEKGLKTVKTIDLSNTLRATTIAANSQNSYSGLAWNKSGKALAFFEECKNENPELSCNKVHFCSNMDSTPKSKILDPLTKASFPKDCWIPLSKLYLSDDSKQLFLNIRAIANEKEIVPTDTQKKLSEISIWNTNDKQVPPPKKEDKPWVSIEKWSVWWPENNSIVAVEDDQHPNAVLTGDQKNALVYNTIEYLPQFEYVGEYIDLYLKDLKTGNKKLIVKKIINEFKHTVVSPSGKYIAYFKLNNWWVYNIATGKSNCITAEMNIPFYDVECDQAGAIPPYDLPGWTSNDEKIILYDQFDIWLMTNDGSKKEKITDGRKRQITYRIYDGQIQRLVRNNFYGFVAKSYTDKEGLLLETVDNSTLQQTYCIWNKGSGIKEFIRKDMKLFAFQKAKKSPVFQFMESRFDVSPKLMLLTASGKEKQIAQANGQQKDFFWGKSELIHYLNADGKPLKGALFYPADYVPGKKYPMIVNVYQKKSDEVYNYVAPSLKLINGFNPTNFTAEGYFVLMPDLAYKLNEPGNSALNCVEAAVAKVLEMGSVDKNNVGLIGHSYGGVETTYMIGHTNIFKTAVAGAPATDLLSFYLSSGGYGQSNIWRFENQQFRIQAPFYSEEFLKNSPIGSVQNINTPLLIWTGNEDKSVDWSNSTKLQTALWRLNKKSTLIVYPGQEHVLTDQTYQEDLYFRVKNWFDYYLKGVPSAGWMANN